MEIVAATYEDQLKTLLMKLSQKKNMNLPIYIENQELSLENFFQSMEQMHLITPDSLHEIQSLLTK
jgi:hypothetical protein